MNELYLGWELPWIATHMARLRGSEGYLSQWAKEIPTGWAFYLLTPQRSTNRNVVRRFSGWLITINTDCND